MESQLNFYRPRDLDLELSHIVGLVYNYRISLLENFTGETKNVIIFLQSDRFCWKYLYKCKI